MYRTVLYRTVQCITVLYITELYKTVLYRSVLFTAVLYRSVPYTTLTNVVSVDPVAARAEWCLKKFQQNSKELISWRPQAMKNWPTCNMLDCRSGLKNKLIFYKKLHNLICFLGNCLKGAIFIGTVGISVAFIQFTSDHRYIGAKANYIFYMNYIQVC